MCLSTVYASENPEQVIMEYVSKIMIRGDEITLTDVMGEQKVVTGTLVMADLTGAVVKIDLK
ncbi:MAG: CooT family nickel-binding protein [Lachnospiraceae bacterium]|nr:CooT family nickel-binding protein [Lachnospiraceae bacterium]